MCAELVCHNMSAGYGRSDVLRGFSAAFAPRQLHALLGPNGAGKTTLLRALTGYLPLRGGSMMLGGQDLSVLGARGRAKLIAAVPQIALQHIPLTVREAVMLARFPHLVHQRPTDMDEQVAGEQLAAAGLCELADRRCGELSGGELRRVLITQGLAQQPRVLLLDEPTAFLDPPARVQVMRLLKQQASQGLCAVAVLHDPQLARLYANNVVLLKGGEALTQGAPGEVLTGSMLAELYGCPEEMLAEVI